VSQKPNVFQKSTHLNINLKTDSFKRIRPKCQEDDDPLLHIDETDELSFKIDTNVRKTERKIYVWDFN